VVRRRKSLIAPLKEEATSQKQGFGTVREKERRKKERRFVKAREMLESFKLEREK